MHNEPIAKGTLVELLDQYSDVYPQSPSGARGWVRSRREMDRRETEVFIEWDKSHWRYHGERDGWTFEHHFRPVDDTIPSLGLDRILADAQDRVDEDRCSHCGELHLNDQEAYLETLTQAQDAALGADAFFTITLTPVQDGDSTIYQPVVFAETLNETARQMIETQIIHIAAQIFETDMIDRVNSLEDHDN